MRVLFCPFNRQSVVSCSDIAGANISTCRGFWCARIAVSCSSKHSYSLPSRSCAVPQNAGHFGVSPFGCLVEDFTHRLRQPFRENISSENPRLEHAVLLPDVVSIRHFVPVTKRIPLKSGESQEVSFGRFNDSVCHFVHSLILWGRKSGRRPVATKCRLSAYLFSISHLVVRSNPNS